MPPAPADAFNIFSPTAAVDPARALQDHWMRASAKCKDVLVLALPMKEVPLTKDAFSAAGANEFIRAQFYVVRIGSVDGQDWGWSNAPYDCAKKTPRSDLKPLYTVDDQGDTKSETRFWAFKKVSNNKNKGCRVDEHVDGVDTSFVVPRGSVLTFFVREDSYEAGKSIFVNAGEQTHIPAFAPVILQLSGTNSEQAAKGNGLKLRRIMPLHLDALAPFMDDLCCSKRDALERQDAARRYPAIANVASRSQSCPVVCSILSGAFVYQDAELDEQGVVELVESGLEPDMGSVLHLPTAILRASLHTEDFERAKRFLCVALGHGAVKCLVVPSDAPGVAVVQHLDIDMQKMLWLPTMQKMRTSDRPAELPNTDSLVMCFGRRIGVDASGAGFGSEGPLDVLQVPCALPDMRGSRTASDGVACAVVQPVQVRAVGGGGRPRCHELLCVRDGPGNEALARSRRGVPEVLSDGRGGRVPPRAARLHGRAAGAHPRDRPRRERERAHVHHVAAPPRAQELGHGLGCPRAAQTPLFRAR